MNQLITIKVQDNQQLVSARELHKGLKIKKRFSAWVEQNFKDFENGTDFTSVPEGTVVESGNGTKRRYDDYALTLGNGKRAFDDEPHRTVVKQKFKDFEENVDFVFTSGSVKICALVNPRLCKTTSEFLSLSF
ncbi:hypothetical protein FD50_GL000086 [Liquorilactobacillus satsumensis DSM 16230 = JCM 12392]|uniref:AntA/AntB antirepressor domain-containing protein n=1 Tax=Liquorilactobacillus satsumensis DSM 16230 = JCM 12392 TaxID=1423801 RepID=A0A0R1V9R8_9LACO|nr:hypothetical protein FD50_GL000086 [Liquorilactobacillus satsumensis DSM 16230 = JCM 12392]